MKNNCSTRLLSIFLAFLMIFSVLPFVVEAEDSNQNGTSEKPYKVFAYNPETKPINDDKKEIDIGINKGETVYVRIYNASGYNKDGDGAAKDFTFESSDSEVATIKNNKEVNITNYYSKSIEVYPHTGTYYYDLEILGKSTGKATITATGGSSSSSTYKAIINVTVNETSVGNDGETFKPNSVVFAASDYQYSNAKKNLSCIVENMREDYIEFDNVIWTGDYCYDSNNNPEKGIIEIKEVFDDLSDDFIFCQGNHDNANSLLAKTDEYDNADYGVYIINEDDLPSTYNRNEEMIKNVADKLKSYLATKLNVKYNKPIFIVTHVPLHETRRNDNPYSNYIFDVINNAAESGLNIFFLCGHNHSGNYDINIISEYEGGNIYKVPGDKLKITGKKEDVKLNFYYINPGYVGSNELGKLSASVFEIYDNTITIKRYYNDESELVSHEVKLNLNFEESSAHIHDSINLKHDKTNHWYECSECGEMNTGSKEEHIVVAKLIKEPSVTEKGTMSYKCSYCGYEKDIIEIPVLTGKIIQNNINTTAVNHDENPEPNANNTINVIGNVGDVLKINVKNSSEYNTKKFSYTSGNVSAVIVETEGEDVEIGGITELTIYCIGEGEATIQCYGENSGISGTEGGSDQMRDYYAYINVKVEKTQAPIEEKPKTIVTIDEVDEKIKGYYFRTVTVENIPEEYEQCYLMLQYQVGSGSDVKYLISFQEINKSVSEYDFGYKNKDTKLSVWVCDGLLDLLNDEDLGGTIIAQAQTE